MAKKLTVVERTLIDTINRDEYRIYRCPTHGVYAQRNDAATGECAYSCGYIAEGEYVV